MYYNVRCIKQAFKLQLRLNNNVEPGERNVYVLKITYQQIVFECATVSIQYSLQNLGISYNKISIKQI